MDLTTQSPAIETVRPATERLRRASLGALLALLIQYGIGMAVNIYVTVPAADQGHGIGTAFGKSMSGPAALAAHTGIGLLLIINVIVVFILSLRSKLVPIIVTGTLGLLCVVGAAFSGVNFVNTNANSASMAMAVMTGVALACYAINLYVLGGRRSS